MLQGLSTDLLLVPQEAAKEALYRRNLVENEVSSSGIGGQQGRGCGHELPLTPGASSPAAAAPQVRD